MEKIEDCLPTEWERMIRYPLPLDLSRTFLTGRDKRFIEQ